MHYVVYMYIYPTGPPPDYMHDVIYMFIYSTRTVPLRLYAPLAIYIVLYILLDHPHTICIMLYTCSYIRHGPPPYYMHYIIYMFIYSTGPPPDYMHDVTYMFIYFVGPPPYYMLYVSTHVHIFDWTNP